MFRIHPPEKILRGPRKMLDTMAENDYYGV